MLYMTSADYLFFVVASTLIIRDVISLNYQTYGYWNTYRYSKGIYFTGLVIVVLLWAYVCDLFSGFDVNSLKLYIIFLIFLGVEIYKSMTQQLISEKFLWLSSKQENKVLRICGTVLVIGMLALIIAIKI